MLNNQITQTVNQFSSISAIEWFGVITGLICVYLAVKQNILNWPVSILSVLSYTYIFYNTKLYGDAILQLYFLATAIYGWYYWTGGRATSLKSTKPIVKITRKEWLVICMIWLFASAMAGFLLSYFTDSDVPYIDGLCTATSFIAQFLMTRKKLENWLIWIFVDALYIPLYIHKNLFATAILYFVFLFIALKGYLDWKKVISK